MARASANSSAEAIGVGSARSWWCRPLEGAECALDQAFRIGVADVGLAELQLVLHIVTPVPRHDIE